MYSGVPTPSPVSVMPPTPAAVIARATPKSATTACPLVQQDVLRLDVAVDHAVGMGVVQRVGHLAGDLQGVVERQLLLARQPVPEGFAFHEGHDIEEELARLTGIEERQDVGVAQVGRGGDLTQEALPAQRGGELGAEHLDGDLALVPEILGEVDRGHPARTELALDGVAADERRCDGFEDRRCHVTNMGTARTYC